MKIQNLVGGQGDQAFPVHNIIFTPIDADDAFPCSFDAGVHAALVSTHSRSALGMLQDLEPAEIFLEGVYAGRHIDEAILAILSDPNVAHQIPQIHVFELEGRLNSLNSRLRVRQ